MSALRVAILAHSTNPRGGVVHALELGDALTGLGHEVVVHAPDAMGKGFFRPTVCGVAAIAASAVDGGVAAMVETRVADYLRYFDDPATRRFDVYHAQDGISGSALATLKARGLIGRFARTVHHIDDFQDRTLASLQRRSILAADELFAVSRVWRDILRERFGRDSTIVGNGVDRARYRAAPDGREGKLRERLGLGAGPVFLSIGGVEERKNTIRLLEAFDLVRKVQPNAQLVIAGGASLLDHGAYQRRFAEMRGQMTLPAEAVVLAGPTPHEEMPALYRLASALVFPSVKEGYGLVVLEAMASGVPAVVSAMPPFTEYLAAADVVWCDPFRVTTIADAMLAAIGQPLRGQLAQRGRDVVARHDWRGVAKAHLAVYADLREGVHA